MRSDPLFLLIIAICLLVAVILALGIAQFVRGGIEGAKKSNKFMQARIAAQLVAVVLVVLFVWLRNKGG